MSALFVSGYIQSTDGGQTHFVAKSRVARRFIHSFINSFLFAIKVIYDMVVHSAIDTTSTIRQINAFSDADYTRMVSIRGRLRSSVICTMVIKSKPFETELH